MALLKRTRICSRKDVPFPLGHASHSAFRARRLLGFLLIGSLGCTIVGALRSPASCEQLRLSPAVDPRRVI